MSKSFLYWWALNGLQFVAFGLLYNFGVFNIILLSDPTFLSFIIIAIHIVLSLYVGISAYYNINKDSEFLWMIAENQLTLGMIGTLIGFIIMFSSGIFLNLSPENVQVALLQIAAGLGAAIWTTLTGLVSAAILKVQLYILDN